MPVAPSERLPALVSTLSPGAEKVQELGAPLALNPIMSPDFTGRFTATVLSPLGQRTEGACPTTWKTSGSGVLRKILIT